jgi:hypothetical protein
MLVADPANGRHVRLYALRHRERIGAPQDQATLAFDRRLLHRLE